jgi:[acyl-carrier-protein] S-malonyltransferase
MSTAVVFAGQGSQYVGMGVDFISEDREWFTRVDESLEFPLEEYLRDGPAELLARTDITQPAVFVVNHLIYRYLRKNGLEADYYAGHSLGEYNALVASGRVDLETLLPVVVERGRAMHEAAEQVDGGMAAVLKLDADVLKSICESVSEDDAVEGTVEIGLLNAPGQVVVSGAQPAIDEVVERAKDEGALKAVPLDVSGPWHSRYMRPATDRLRDVLETVEWSDGAPVVANVTARPLGETSPVTTLIDQLEEPVRWQASVDYMIEEGVDTFVEAGPGDSLSGMINRIARGHDTDVDVFSTDTLEHTREILEEVQ